MFHVIFPYRQHQNFLFQEYCLPYRLNISHTLFNIKLKNNTNNKNGLSISNGIKLFSAVNDGSWAASNLQIALSVAKSYGVLFSLLPPVVSTLRLFQAPAFNKCSTTSFYKLY